MGSLAETIRALGPSRIAAMGAVAVVLVGFFAFILLRFSQPQMSVLYTDLSFDDSSAIIQQLESTNVPHEVKNNGATLLVPKSDLLRLRMRLAEDGLPTGGGMGYEIFDKTDTLGTTSFVQNINHVRAIEGELARTIRSMDRISAARVHLVIPKRELFAKEPKEATASIVVKSRGTLEKSHISAIQHLVAAAVDGLKINRVSIVDETGKLLAAGDGDSINGLGVGSLQERTLDFQHRLRSQVEQVVESIVGAGRARVQVSAELDFNRITETSDIYDPDGQVVRSTQSRTENSSSSNPTSETPVSVGEALPGANAEGEQATNKQAAETSEEVVNYEISRTTRTEIIEAGGIKRLSVAVLVDGLYEQAQDGTVTYGERDPAQLEKIATLVRSAIGFDQSRGDVVEVVNMQFASSPNEVPLDETAPGLFDFDQSDYFRMAEIGVTLILGLMVVFFVARPLVNKVLAPVEPELATADGTLPATGEGAEAADGQIQVDPSDPSSIEKALIAGAVQDRSLEKIGQLVDEHPDAAAMIVRNWLTEAA